MLDRKFGNIIWTNHALQRLKERNIKQGDAWATWRNPQESRYAETKGAWIFYRTYGNQKIEVVAKQNERKEWVVLSVWSKPVFEKYTKKSQSIFQLLLKRILNKKA